MKFGAFFIALTFSLVPFIALAADSPALQCLELFLGRSADAVSVSAILDFRTSDSRPIPEMDPAQFSEIVPLANKRTFLAKYNSQSVFMKIARGGSVASLEEEINWTIRLNAVGLGAKLIGFTKIDGATALVTLAAEGDNSQFPMIADDSVRLTKNVQAEMKRQLRVIYENQIWPLDLQFLISNRGQVTLIDPELYQPDPQRTHPWNNYEVLLGRIFQLWQMDDRLDD